jgi:hypothetical protein
MRWEYSWDSELAFRKFKTAFSNVPILNHIIPAKSNILQSDASAVVLPGIINQ